MPSEGVELSPGPNILSDDEVIRLASIFVKCGVTKIRLTGGEPTVRKNIIELVGTCWTPCSGRKFYLTFFPGRLGELRRHGLKSIAMTSNGVALHRKLPALIDNGFTHLNLRFALSSLENYSKLIDIA